MEKPISLTDGINEKSELTEVEKKKICSRDNLDEDDDLPCDQKWICISIAPHKKSTSLYGFKFRGAYATEEEAMTRSKELQEKDRYFNIFVGPAGKWVPFDDNPENAKECFYSNKEEDKLIKEHESDQAKAKSYMRQREAYEKQSKSIKELNELVGEHKAILDKESIKFDERKQQLIETAKTTTKEQPIKMIKNKKIVEQKEQLDKSKIEIKEDDEKRKKMFEEYNILQQELMKKKQELEEQMKKEHNEK